MATLTIVTGGSAGLGRSLLDVAPSGYRVDVSRSGPPPGVDEHLAVDLADPDRWSSVGDLFERLAHQRIWDRIVLIHNAGTLEPIGFAGEVDPDAYDRNVLVNSAAAQAIGARFLRAVRDVAGRRELVQVSSGAATTAYPGWSSYGAAKAAVDHWVRTVGAEQDRRGGVRVLAIAPGVVATGMQELIRSTDEHDFPPVARFRGLHERGELADPDDVARRLWRRLDDDDLTSGTVLDLRAG